MEDNTTNFDSIKHRSIEYASGSNLIINISNLIFLPKILSIGGIIGLIIGLFLIIIKSKIFGYILLCLGGILLIIGIILFVTIKYKFEFNFIVEKLIVKISGLISSTDKVYLISKLEYIIIDQMHVENDEEGRENALSIGSEQNKIPSKIIINSIDEGFEEIFNGSGNPPLFTNDEVQFFNQFMKNNINRIKNES
jgi:hypothetical protein